MLKNFWYGCEFSSQVSSSPKQIEMLGQKFILFRDKANKVVALQDQCPHRGAALSLGWLEDGCIRCPYHGWKFGSDGKCVDIPANGNDEMISHHAKVRAYDVEEKYGFVWLFYGELKGDERPPIPPLAEAEAGSTWHCSELSFPVDTHYTRVLENSIDVAHLPIVHSTSFGAGLGDSMVVPDYDVVIEELSGSANILYKSYKKPKGLFGLFFNNKGVEVRTKLTFYMPNITKVESGTDKISIINYAIHLPVNDNVTISKRLLFRNFLPFRFLDKTFLKYYTKVYQEDSLVSESQRPRLVPERLSAEIHTPSDRLQIAYRKMRNRYLCEGDPMAIDASTSNHVASDTSDSIETREKNKALV
jgi:phenylpropionate dioxygenase-like ring-hydroxylating dioxygenase large terminal subunit